jgi:integrase
MPYVETRGGSIRVKWWGGEYKPGKPGPDGKPTKVKKYESASGPEPGVKFQNEREAEDFGKDREYEVRHGKHIRRVDSRTLMESYCWVWFDAAEELQPNSVKSYRSMLNAAIVPYWGDRPVGDITPPEYDAWKKQIKQSYSENYVKGLLGLFRRLMEDAVVKYKLRPETPVVEQRRRGQYVKRNTRRVKRILPIEVVHHLATNAYTVWGFAGWTYIWTVGFTGMRPPGEMYGLQRGFASPNWPASDPDPDRREDALERYEKMHALRVQHQTYKAGGESILAGPKYGSYRTLAIPPFLHDMHSALLASHNSPWVFTSTSGKPMLGSQFHRSYWWPIRDGAPERKGRFARPAMAAVEAMAGQDLYRLRHWAKEILDEAGDISRVAIEARMGHELPGVEGVYSYVTPAMERRIVDYLQGVWETFWASGPWWAPPFPKPLPDGQRAVHSPLFSGLPIIGER